jgi:hypothetical protein
MTIQANFPNLKPSLLLDFANTKQLDSRITFTRASTGGFYNGVTTAMAEQNFLTYSQQFDNAAWVKSGITVTADSTAAPDGTTTADTITETATTSEKLLVGSVTAVVGATYTFSVFAKRNGRDMQMCFGGSHVTGDPYVNFDLSAGTVAVTSGSITATITASTNGFYRCTATVVSAITTFQPLINLINSTSATRRPSYAGDGTSGVYLWGAQFETRSTATAYTATTTQAITNYIPALQTAASGVARFDNNPTTGESLGLLIEESRTNLITYSEQYDNAAWSKQLGGVEANTIVAPDGTLSGDKAYEKTTSASQNIFQSIAQTATTYAFTVYVKKGQNDRFVMFAGSPQALLWIDMTTWTAFTSTNVVSSSITPVGNSWYRCTMVYTNTSASSFQTGINIIQVGTSNTTSYTGNGFNGIYLWGAQLEAGAFATSYIPTVASQVTRAADAASMTGTNFSSWYNGGESGIYGEFNLPALGGSQALLHLTDTAEANRVRIYAQLSGITRFTVTANGSTLFNNDVASVTTGSSKTAIGIKSGSYGTVRNAGTVGTNSSIPTPNGPTELRIGRDASSGYLNGSIKKISVYPIRPTDAQLQALTS